MDFLTQDDLLVAWQIEDQKLWNLDLSAIEARVLAFSKALSDLRLVSGKTIGPLLYGSFFVESFFATARKRLLEIPPLREALQNLPKVRDLSPAKPEPYYRQFSKTKRVADGLLWLRHGPRTVRLEINVGSTANGGSNEN